MKNTNDYIINIVGSPAWYLHEYPDGRIRGEMKTPHGFNVTHDKKDESQGYTIIMIKKYLHTQRHICEGAKKIRKYDLYSTTGIYT